MNKQEFMQKLQKIVAKWIFPIEFMVALFMAYSCFKATVLKNYAGMIPIKYDIYIGISVIVLLAIIIYVGKQNKKKVEKIIISFLIPIGMLYTIFMLPSQIPDELGHLWRAYEVSEGNFISSKEVSTVPRELVYHQKGYVETYQEFNEALSTTTDYNDRVEVNSTFKAYLFFLYMFSAVGFFIARVFHLNILLGCYLACLMNFIVFLISTYYAIKMLPFGKWSIISILFMPMFLHQATSTSADCIINCLALLTISFITHLLFKESKITKKEKVIFFVLCILLSLSKYVYLPLIGMSLLLVFSKNMDKKEKIRLFSITFIAAIVFVILYFMFDRTYENPHKGYMEQNHVNMQEQAKQVLLHPIHYIKTLGTTLYVRGQSYVDTMVGSALGWLNISVPYPIIMTYIVVMVASCFIEKNKVAFATKQKVFCMLVAVGTIVLVITGLYLHWTGVGADIVEGVQGRYFIPVMFLIALCVGKKENYVKIKNIQFKLPILLCFLNLCVLNTIYNFFK